jgi:S1-C subfamily serine protease
MTGGPGVPVEISQCTSTSTCYWEEYETETGKPNEQLVWVHFVVGVDAVRSMVGRYSDLVTVTGNQLVTVFPGVALQPDQAGNGAMVIKLGRGPLAKSGIAVKSVISEVDSKPITDAPQLAHTLDEAAKADRQVILGVTAGSEPLQQLPVRL